MALRTHLFPSRTQKLSSIAPKVLGWTRPGRLGRCRISVLDNKVYAVQICRGYHKTSIKPDKELKK